MITSPSPKICQANLIFLTEKKITWNHLFSPAPQSTTEVTQFYMFVSFIPYFRLLIFGILVPWFSFRFFFLAPLALQNVDKDNVMYFSNFVASDQNQKPKIEWTKQLSVAQLVENENWKKLFAAWLPLHSFANVFSSEVKSSFYLHTYLLTCLLAYLLTFTFLMVHPSIFILS